MTTLRGFAPIISAACFVRFMRGLAVFNGGREMKMSYYCQKCHTPVLKGASKCPGCGARFIGEGVMSDAARREIEEKKRKREREREKAKKAREKAKRKKEQLARLQEMPAWQKPIYKRYIAPGFGVGCLGIILSLLVPFFVLSIPFVILGNDPANKRLLSVFSFFFSLPIALILLRLSVGLSRNAEQRNAKMLSWVAIIINSFWGFLLLTLSCSFFLVD
jgi:uncharacterized Zn finger protein (UPF0148 family)